MPVPGALRSAADWVATHPVSTFLAVFAVFPFLVPYQALATQVLIWGLFALGFNLLHGYTGLLSFGHAAYACRMLSDWGQASCGAFGIDMDAVKARHARSPAVLEAIRTTADPGFLPLRERERLITERTGRRRPPSFFLYPYLGWLRFTGEGPWIPPSPPKRATLVTWAMRTASPTP